MFTSADKNLSLIEAFSQIKRKKVLLVGDLILDRYTFGVAQRISPEAPVPVLNVDHEDIRLGGVGNVAYNLSALNQDVTVLSRIGRDSSGDLILESFKNAGIASDNLLIDSTYQTPTKVRLIASSQQIARIDYEKITPISDSIHAEVLERIPELVENADIIAISDYAKGFLTDQIISFLIQKANEKGIPVVTDPKGTRFDRYSGTTLLKPNFQEACAAAHLSSNSSIEEIAKNLHDKLKMDVLMITRSENGISLFYRDGRSEHFAVSKKEVRDVTGAGDTVLSVLVSGIVSGLDLAQTIPLCNIAASLAIEKVGCAVVSWDEIAGRYYDTHYQSNFSNESAHCPQVHQELLHTGKVLTRRELPFLEYAFKKKQVCLLQIPSKSHMDTLKLIRSIHERSRESKKMVIAHFLDTLCPIELIEAVASLKSVDAVLTGCISEEEARLVLPRSQLECL